MRSFTSFLVALALAALLWPASAAAQGVTTATIRGVVKDSTGATLPGANVVAVHQPSGSQYGTSTNNEGRYTLANVRVGGPYVIEASFVGYRTKRETGINLSLGESRTVSFTLQEDVEQLGEVEVVARRGGVFDRERTGVSTTITEEEIDNTPNLDRSIADFARLTPQAYVENDDDDGAAISIAGQNNRYNSFFIDGAVANDVFGLSAQGVDGGQTGATPISIEAIEQFEINISPFDVTQSFFGGGAINAITKSGTNQYEGLLIYERRDDAFTQDLPGGDFPAFSNNRYIANFSGPIIKDKLFFFVNAEILRSESPLPFEGGFEEFNGNNLTSNAAVQDFRNFVDATLGFDPGSFRGNASTLDSDKFLAKLDWNITPTQRLSARYSYTGSENVDAFNSNSFNLNFNGRNEVFPNDTHIAAIELNSAFSNRFANKLIASYKSVVDDRDTNFDRPVPTFDIDDGGATLRAGSEPFSTVNRLEQDVFTLTNNLNVFLGNHTLTVGTHNEFYSLGNAFIPRNFGDYDFDSFEGFQVAACLAADNPDERAECQALDEDPGTPGFQFTVPPEGDEDRNDFLVDFERSFSLQDDDPTTPEFESVAGDATNAIGAFDALLTGFYLQDEWQATERLRLTAGLRVNFPFILDDPRFADDVFSATLSDIAPYYDFNGARPGDVPNPTPHWEPRFGFNYDVFGDQRTQVRGGVGVFTSRQPFVWQGGMFLNNGVNAGEIDVNDVPITELPIRTNPDNFLLPADVPGADLEDNIPSGRLEIFEEDYKLPRFLRYALGVDQELPGGIIATLEGQYTNTLQNILVTNINLLPPNETLDGPDERPIWALDEYDNASVGSNSNRQRIDGRYSNIHRVGNTDRGYSYDVTARLRSTFDEVFGSGSALNTSLSYTYGDARVVNDGTSSQINSIWDGVEHVNGANNLDLSRSDFSLGHRVLAQATYRQVFGKNFAGTFTLLYIGESGRPFSFVIDDSDDMVRELGDPNSLLYVPRTASELTFEETRVQGVTVTPAQQAAALDQFISENDYLSRRRGQYAERNGDRTPWEGVVDLNTEFQVFGDLIGRQQSLAITLDIFNFSSLLGDIVGQDHWGERFIGFSQFRPIEFQRFVDPDSGDYTPVYEADQVVDVVDTDGDGEPDTFNGAISQDEVFNRLVTGSTFSSQWQLRLGVKYRF
jgi:hypothetical protein